MHIDLSRLSLGKDGDGVAARDLAQGEDALEAFDPLTFESIAQQSLSPSLPAYNYTPVDVRQDNLAEVLGKDEFVLTRPDRKKGHPG